MPPPDNMSTVEAQPLEEANQVVEDPRETAFWRDIARNVLVDRIVRQILNDIDRIEGGELVDGVDGDGSIDRQSSLPSNSI